MLLIMMLHLHPLCARMFVGYIPKTPTCPHDNAYTTNWNKTSNEATLVRWVVSTEGKNFTNDYFDVKTIPGSEESSFAASFNVPAICEKAMSCGDANKKGLLKDDKLKFVRR